jgi:hypothetical protein
LPPRRVHNAALFNHPQAAPLTWPAGLARDDERKLISVPILRTEQEQDPAGIRTAARELITAVEDQLADLRGSNDPTTRDFIDFLETLAVGLNRLAEALDQALGAAPDQQQVFLGTAGKIAEQLKIGLLEFVEGHRATIAGYAIKIGLVGAGFNLLCTMGLGAEAAALASGLLGYKLPTEPKAKN